jgi:hypothetical protein
LPKHKRSSKEDYRRGDIVWYFSEQGGRGKASRAVFVTYDYKGYPDRDCILAIRVGTKKNYIIQKFRWPLRLVGPS